MDSQEKYAANPPAYTSLQGSTPYPTSGAAPAAVPYPQSGTQQYPPVTQYRHERYPPTAAGQAAYGQPQFGYPTQPGYGNAQYTGAPLQHEQQQVVVVSSGQPQPVMVQHVTSYVGHIVFACIVFWCCNWLFGLIAFILAMVASSTAVSDPRGARKLGHASIGLSVAGIIITVVIVIVVVAVSVTSCPHKVYGSCYRHRKYSHPYDYCSGIRSGGYCYYY